MVKRAQPTTTATRNKPVHKVMGLAWVAPNQRRNARPRHKAVQAQVTMTSERHHGALYVFIIG